MSASVLLRRVAGTIIICKDAIVSLVTKTAYQARPRIARFLPVEVVTGLVVLLVVALGFVLIMVNRKRDCAIVGLYDFFLWARGFDNMNRHL